LCSTNNDIKDKQKQMKKTLLFIALLFGAMLIAGTIDESTRQLEQQPNTINK